MKPRRVKINVSGLYFETYEKTLQRFPNTLLGSMKRRQYYYDETREEYFFNRNRLVFDAVLFYYQSNGILYKPPDIEESIFVEELHFFHIHDSRGNLATVANAHNFISGNDQPTPTFKVQRRVWNLFSNPSSSFCAAFVEVMSIMALVNSVTISCIETLPQIKPALFDKTKSITKFFTVSNYVCYGWFTFEYIMRLSSSADKIRYLKTFDSTIDLFAIVPFFIQIFLMHQDTTVFKLAMLRLFRILRVARVLRITRYSRGMRALTYTIYASWHDLQVFFTVAMMIIVLLSSVTFFFERGHDGNLITSIPQGIWWSINTFTTVGYGDTYPRTTMGKILGSICSMVGIIFLGLPVYCLVTNFLTFWTAMKDMEQPNNLLVKGFQISLRRLARLKASHIHSN